MSEPRKPTSAILSARDYALIGVGAFVIFIALTFGWGALASLSGAVIARGAVVVQSDAKKVQHPYGGVVAEIRIKNGDVVKSGDILIRLDETLLRANLTSIQKSIAELRLRRARLFAERDGLDRIEFYTHDAGSTVDLTEAARNEMRLFELRTQMRNGRKAQTEERIRQLKSEIWGYQLQQDSTDAQIKFVNQELEATRSLWAQQLVTLARVSSLEREAARLDGVRGQLVAGVAQTEGKISEARLSILQIDKEWFSDVGAELREVDAKIAPLEEQLVSAQDQLSRVMIAAPTSGIVHQLNAKTVGGVISPAEVLLLIVPTEDPLFIDAQVNPVDIDQVRMGAPTLIRLTALNQRTTPELTGEVEQISPDAIIDQRNGSSYYTVRVTLPSEQIKRLQGLPVVPGMPTEVFIKTNDRRVFEIILKPISDQLMRAYRQD